MCSSSYLIPFKKILVLLTKDEENRSYAHCQLDSKIVCGACIERFTLSCCESYIRQKTKSISLILSICMKALSI